MTVALVAYDRENTTAVATLTTARGIAFGSKLNGRAALRFTWTPDDDAAPVDAADPHRWVRVRINGTDVAAYRVEVPTRRYVDGGTDVDVSAVSAVVALDGATLFPQGGSTRDYGLDSAARWFGFMSDSYVQGVGWEPAAEVVDDVGASYDVWDTPFGNLHDGWPDPEARYLWSDDVQYGAGGFAGPQYPTGSVWFRRTFTVSAEVDAIVAVSGNDEYELYLDGTLLASGDEPRARDTTELRYVKLAPGDHLLAARCENIDYIGTGLRPAWLLVSVLAANGAELDGEDQQDTLELDAGVTDGTFTVTIDGDTTDPIAYDATPETVRRAIIAAMFPRVLFVGRPLRPSDGDLDVAGTGQPGDPYVLSWTGWRTARRTHTVTVDGTALVGGTITATRVREAAAPGRYVTGDDTWSCLPYPTEPPGVTVGEIVTDLVDEAAARNAGPGINGTDVTAAVDSAGVAWPGLEELSFPVGRTLDGIVAALVDLDYDVDVSPAGLVRVWDRRGADRTGTVSLTDADATVSLALQAPIATRLLVGHQAGFTETASANPPAGKRREAYLSVGSVASDSAAAALGATALRDLGRDRDSATFEVPAGTFDGHADADLGDLVTATGWSGGTVPQRIVELTAAVPDTTGDPVWTVHTVADLTVRRAHDRYDDADYADRVRHVLDQMADGTVGGRVRTATPLRYVPQLPARAARSATFRIDPLADQQSNDGDEYAAPPPAAPPAPAQGWQAAYWADDLELADGANITSWPPHAGVEPLVQDSGGGSELSGFATYDADGVGGRPAASFAGDAGLRMQGAWPATPSEPVTIVAVFTSTSSGVKSITTGGQTTAMLHTDGTTALDFRSAGSSSPTAGIDLTTPTLFVGTTLAGTVTRVNRADSATVPTTHTATDRIFTVGAYDFSTALPLTGRIAFLGFANGALSVADRDEIEAWLVDRYGIA